ncbi:MAG: type II toxin-antitoxin system Phd/YefM family antitoxin [Oceanospirillaceae bacterium]|nr:type II toxin-antitoxin system Phd/YefM family antitoxin [Oceanospirillaceae bacterium]
MDAISYTSARTGFASTMAKVSNDPAPIIITRKMRLPL